MKKHLNVNTVLIGLLVIVSLGVFGYQKFFKNSLSADNGIAEVYVGNQVVKRIPLNKDETYTITQGLLTCTIDVKDGKAAFINSQCPDHLCEGFGYIGNEHDFAICAPANVGMMITSPVKK